MVKNTVSPTIDSRNACDFTTLEFELILDVDGIDFGTSRLLWEVSVNAGHHKGKILYLL